MNYDRFINYGRILIALIIVAFTVMLGLSTYYFYNGQYGRGIAYALLAIIDGYNLYICLKQQKKVIQLKNSELHENVHDNSSAA